MGPAIDQIRQPITILFQPPNGIGLGHISRLVAIALAIRDKMPSARLPFLLEGGSHSLLESASLPYLSLPTNDVLFGTESWAAWPKEERQTIMLEIADSIIHQLQPNVILFDTLPCTPVARAAAHRKVSMALCVRKRRDMPEFFGMMSAFQEQLQYLNLILIPHEPDEVEVPNNLMPKTRFVGRIVRPIQKTHVGIDFPSNSKIVVISGGGGGYPNTVDFYNRALAAFASSRTRNPTLAGILITGPLFQDWWRLRVVDGVRVIPFDPNLTSTLAAADLTICQAGYNTIAEIVHLGIPIICVPADRAFDDQFERAERAAASTPNFHICRAQEADQLTHLIDSCLQNHSQTRFDGEMASTGAIKAADALLELIHDHVSVR